MLIAAVRADEVENRSKDAKHECCVGKLKSKGTLFRGFGPNLTDGPGVRCQLFDDKGRLVGLVSSFRNGPDSSINEWNTECGSLVIIVKDRLTLRSPINELAVRSYPSTAPFLNDPNAGLFFSVGILRKSDEIVESWKGTGSFKNVNYFEYLCPFLTYNSLITECLGCHWFMGRE